MEYKKALSLAIEIKNAIAPACDRIELKGGLARRKPDVHDIDIMVQPNGRRPALQFGMKEKDAPRSDLDLALHSLTENGLLRFIEGGQRLKKFSIQQGTLNPFRLELYILLPPAQWGVISVIRTGSEEFSKWMVTSRDKGGALPPQYCCMDGGIRKMSHIEEVLPMPEEEDFFKFCGMPWLAPESRQPQWGRWAKKGIRR